MNENTQRQMDFIVEQQTKFAVDIQKLEESQAELTKKHNNLTGALTTVVGIVGKLGEAQLRTDEHLSELSVKQAETDDRLNALITTVERYISERRNGHSRPATGKSSTRRPKSTKRQRGKR